MVSTAFIRVRVENTMASRRVSRSLLASAHNSAGQQHGRQRHCEREQHQAVADIPAFV